MVSLMELLTVLPILLMALAITCVPLLSDGPPAPVRRRSSDQRPTTENASAMAHITIETSAVQRAKVK